jgi:signal transduction histidine kinase
MAERSIDRCQRLIEDLRTLEKEASSGKELRRYDIRQAAEQIVGMFDLPYRIEGQAQQILADEALNSVLENLIRNAMVHGRTDRVQISISEENGKCLVSVMDWGKGIPNEIKSKIFDEGFSHGESRGTGLGLFIVHEVMNRYGGCVTLRDNAPCGTIFDLTFLIG